MFELDSAALFKVQGENLCRPVGRPFKLSLVLSIVTDVFKDRADRVAEKAAPRHQLSCFIHLGHRPSLHPVERRKYKPLSPNVR